MSLICFWIAVIVDLFLKNDIGYYAICYDEIGRQLYGESG